MGETDTTSIRVTVEARDEARERKPDHMTWSEWLVSDELGYPDAADVADELATRLACVETGGDRFASVQTRNTTGDGDATECPECGNETVEVLGEDGDACPACGWSE